VFTLRKAASLGVELGDALGNVAKTDLPRPRGLTAPLLRAFRWLPGGMGGA